MMMDSMSGDSSSRFEKSLGLLTTKFVTLLQEADGGILDLKVVSVENLHKILDCIFKNQTFISIFRLQTH